MKNICAILTLFSFGSANAFAFLDSSYRMSPESIVFIGCKPYTSSGAASGGPYFANGLSLELYSSELKGPIQMKTYESSSLKTCLTDRNNLRAKIYDLSVEIKNRKKGEKIKITKAIIFQDFPTIEASI